MQRAAVLLRSLTMIEDSIHAPVPKPKLDIDILLSKLSTIENELHQYLHVEDGICHPTDVAPSTPSNNAHPKSKSSGERVIKKGSRELLAIMKSNNKINYESKHHLINNNKTSAIREEEKQKKPRDESENDASSVSTSTGSAKKRARSLDVDIESEGTNLTDKDKKVKQAVEDSSSNSSRPTTSEVDIEVALGQPVGNDRDSIDGGAKAKRRWELRRMRLQDHNILINTTSMASDRSSGDKHPHPKPTNKKSVTVEPVRVPPTTPKGKVLAPKSPGLSLSVSASGGSRPKLWSTAKQLATPQSAPSATTPTSWVCLVCTLENSIRARNCLACNSHRNSSLKTPVSSSTMSVSGVGEGDDWKLLEESKRAPRPPRTYVSTHPYREPKIGTEYQVILDDLPLPGSCVEEACVENWQVLWRPLAKKEGSGEVSADSVTIVDKYLVALDKIQAKLGVFSASTMGGCGGEFEAEALRVLFLCEYDIATSISTMHNLYENGAVTVPVQEEMRLIKTNSLLSRLMPSPFLLPSTPAFITTTGFNSYDSMANGSSAFGDAVSDGADTPASDKSAGHALLNNNLLFKEFIYLMSHHWKDWNLIAVSMQYCTCRFVVLVLC